MTRQYDHEFTFEIDDVDGGHLSLECQVTLDYRPGGPGSGPSYSFGGDPPDPSEIELNDDVQVWQRVGPVNDYLTPSPYVKAMIMDWLNAELESGRLHEVYDERYNDDCAADAEKDYERRLDDR